MEPSKAGDLNKSDWLKAGKAALVWSSAVWLIYVNQVVGTVQQSGHIFSWSDLAPSTFTLGSMVTWLYMQIQGLLIRLNTGK